MNKKTIVLICGTMRNGKDSVANILMEKLDNAKQIEITCYLKRGVSKMLNITREQLEELKDTECVEIKDKSGKVISKTTIRRFLQYQADINRQYITCEKAMEELMSEDKDFYLLTGVRLPDEVTLIKSLHADKRVVVLKIIRTNFEFKSKDKLHKTETLVDLIKEDYNIKAKDMKELRIKADKFYNYLLNTN